MPKELVHDLDPSFTAQLWHELWQNIGYSPFFILYEYKVPLPFNHAFGNLSDSIIQPVTASSLTNTAKNSTI